MDNVVPDPPDEEPVTGPDGLFADDAVPGRDAGRRQLVPAVGGGVVGGGVAEGVVPICLHGRVAAEDDELLAGPDADGVRPRGERCGAHGAPGVGGRVVGGAGVADVEVMFGAA